jgi:hypothetical protein
MSAMIYTLAMLQAKRRVKDQIRKEGKKLHDYKARDITVMAGVYCELHREELIAETRATIERSAELKKMFEKEQKLLGSAHDCGIVDHCAGDPAIFED